MKLFFVGGGILRICLSDKEIAGNAADLLGEKMRMRGVEPPRAEFEKYIITLYKRSYVISILCNSVK